MTPAEKKAVEILRKNLKYPHKIFTDEQLIIRHPLEMALIDASYKYGWNAAIDAAAESARGDVQYDWAGFQTGVIIDKQSILKLKQDAGK